MFQKLNEQSTAVKIVIMLVIAALVGGSYWYFYVMPTNDQNKADTIKLKAKLDENAKLKPYELMAADLDRQIAALKQQMELQKNIVPDDKEADQFIKLLQQTATSAGINLRKLEAKAVATKQYYTEVPYTIEIDGPYYGVLNFFKELGGSTRIVNVDGISIKALGKGQKYQYGPNDSVEVVATAKTFFAREAAEEKPAGPAAAPAKKK